MFYGDESTVTLRAEVRDKTFKPATDATVTLEVSDGLGPPTTLEMTPVAGERGLYEATYETAHAGMFRFEAVAEDRRRRSRSGARAASRCGARTASSSTITSQQNRALLERLAAATGGSYFAVARRRHACRRP